MNEREYKELREASWRRKLTAAEGADLERYLLAHPEERAGWEAEAGLSQLLGEMPDAPLSSNFTSQVMGQVDGMEARRGGWLRDGGWWSRLWVPRLGWAVVLAGVGLLGVQLYYKGVDADVKVMVEALPPEPTVVLRDFETIRVSEVEMDEELWMALNQ